MMISIKQSKKPLSSKLRIRNVKRALIPATKQTAWYSRQRKHCNEVGDKVDASEKEKVQAEIDKVKAILERTQPESMTDADIEELKAAKESLMTNCTAGIC